MHEEAARGARRRARALVVEEEAYARTRGRLFDVALAVLPAYLLLDLGSLKYPWEQRSVN